MTFLRVALLAPFVFLATLSALACDPLPDECELDDNVCDGNVANVCQQPGPEARLMTTRDDCGEARTCVLQSDSRFPGARPSPVCARANAPDCPTEGEHTCVDERTASECIRTSNGRLVPVDHPCGSSFTCEDGFCVYHKS